MNEFEQLKNYKKMLDEGTISEEEYQIIKEKLLKGITTQEAVHQEPAAQETPAAAPQGQNAAAPKNNGENKYASALFFIGIAVIVFGLMGSFMLGEQFLFTGLVFTALSGALILGFAEMINILHDIRKLLTAMQGDKKDDGSAK